MAEQKFNFRAKSLSSLSEPGSSEHDSASIVRQQEHVKQAITRLDTKDHAAMEIKQIPRSRIHNNKKNTYPAVTVNELADSILHYGLQQPLTVVYLLAEDVYLLEAGHQRAAALDQLISTYKDGKFTETDLKLYEEHVKPFERGYPCIVQARLADDIDITTYSSDDIDSLPESVIDSEIRLIITNEVKRPDDPSVRATNVARLAKLYAHKNADRPRAKKININKQIASDLNITERQVANYKNLDNLIPELREEFDQNNLSLKNSTLISKLNAEDQQQILQRIRSGIPIKTSEITALHKEDTIKTLSSEDSDEHNDGIPGQTSIEKDFPEYLPETQPAMPKIADKDYREISPKPRKKPDVEQTEPQPELPILKNNDQRKAWLNDYKAWGLWYYDEHIDVNYYKYDFVDGSRLIVSEYPKRQCYWSYEQEDQHYYHLLEKDKKMHYDSERTYDEKYQQNADSETYMIEFLKNLQTK